MRIRPLLVLLLFVMPTEAFAQALVQPATFKRPAGVNAQETKKTDTGLFNDNALVIRPIGDSQQFSAGSQIFSLRVFGTPKCTDDVCTERVITKLTIDTHIVQSLASDVGAIREYILSRKGSPGSITWPITQWTSRKGELRQTWFAAEPYVSARWIPIAGTESNAGGSLSAGGTVEMHVEFEATVAGSGTTETKYPGQFYVTVSPSISRPLGSSLKEMVFEGITDPNSWVTGFEFSLGFQIKGEQPISIGLTGTYGAGGFKTSTNSVGISVSKMLGAK